MRRWTCTPWVGALLVVAAAGTSFATPPSVTAVYPVPQRVDVPANTVIRVDFDRSIDPATVDGISFRVYGRWSGPASGVTTVNGSRIEFTPSVPFFAGEWVTVNVSRGVENTLGEPMTSGYAWNFWIGTAAGDLDLTYLGRVTCRKGGEAWVQVYGAYAGDINNDGWTDFSAPCEQTHDVRIFLNNGAGGYTSFTAKPVPGGLVPSPNEGADFNNDGEIDLAVGNTGNSTLSVMFGDGTGNFPASATYTTGNSVRGVGVLDLNGDGWDDIVTANRFASTVSILINNGDGTFASAVAREAGANEFSVAVADANNDGLQDVFVGCFSSPYNIVVMLSDGNGDLVAQTPTAGGGQPWQMVVGDFNGDGNVDAAICNTNQSRLAVLLGDGAGGLAAPYYRTVGLFPLAIDTGDIDGDGDLELVTSNYTAGTWTLYENTGATFANARTLLASTAGSCALLHDRDNDGDLDLSGLDEIDDWIYLYDNDVPVTAVTTAPRAALLSLENSPNPFNPATEIRFELTRTADATLAIFDASGAHVVTLRRGALPAGAHRVRWNGADARGERVGSGVYFCRLDAGEEVLTRKLVLLK